jgi:hypothetical protein
MHALKNVRHVQQHVIDKLFDTLQEYELMVNFHLTSVESFSRVLHKLIDLLLYLDSRRFAQRFLLCTHIDSVFCLPDRCLIHFIELTGFQGLSF